MSVFRSTVAHLSRRSRAARQRQADTRLRRAVVEALEPRRLLTGVSILVTGTGDDAGNTSPTLAGDGSFHALTLRDAINFANAIADVGTIQFDPALFSSPKTITLTHQHLDINPRTGMNIIGPGSGELTIDGNNADSVFVVESSFIAPVSIQDVTIKHGNPGIGVGGGVNNKGTLSLASCTVASCTASGDYGGGGIYNSGQITITNCTISQNFDVYQGTANDLNGGGGGIFNKGSMSLVDSTVSGNQTAGGNPFLGYAGGGGILNHGALYALNCTISGNKAANDGGGITNFYYGQSPPTMVLSACTITGNTGGGGGGIYSFGQASITNSTISSNTALDGGGVLNLGVMSLTDSTISINSADSAGGVQNSTRAYANNHAGANSVLTVVGCTIAGNTATKNNGGGIVNLAANGNNPDGPYSSTLSVADTTITGNSAATLGGGIYNIGQHVSVYHNPSRTDVFDDVAHLTITDCTITANSANKSGGNVGAGVYTGTESNCVLNGSIVSANFFGHSVNDDLDGSAYVSGHAFNLIGVDHTGSFTNGSNHNIVGVNNPKLAPLDYYGGPTQAMPTLPGSPAIGGGTIFDGPDNNLITTDQRGFSRPQNSNSAIGAFQPQSSTLVVTTSADDAPTGIDLVNPGQLSLRDAIDLASVIGGSQLIGFAGGLPGTINLNGTELPLNDSSGTITIQGPGTGRLTVNGGGLSTVFANFAHDSANIMDLTITGGQASIFFGGAIGNTGNLSLTNDIITNCSATDGGGIYNGGVLAVSNVTIKNCAASNSGGGIYSVGGTLSLYDSTLSGDTAGLGGGLFNAAGDTSTIANSTISGNIASHGGGGIYAHGTMTVTDSTISANYCGPSDAIGGGGIFNYQSNPAHSISLTIVGSIIDGNHSHPVFLTVPDDLKGGPANGDHNLLGTDATGSFSDHDARGDLIAANPKLGPLAFNGGPTETMALFTGSPAIDVGVAAYFNGHPITTDQRGRTRPQGGGPDMGAYESLGPIFPIVLGAKSHVVVVGHTLSQFVVALEQGGQIDPGNNSNITLSIFSGPSVNLNGQSSLTIPAVQGQAIFNNITFDSFGTYILQADDGINPPVLSPPITFNSVASPVAQLSLDQSEPLPPSVTVGQTLPLIVDVTLNNQLFTGDVSSVSVFLKDPNGNIVQDGNGNDLLLDKEPVTAGTGKASFPNLKILSSMISQTGPGYSLYFTDGNYTPSTSPLFAIAAPTPVTTLVVSAPATAVAGSTISPAVTVTVEQNGIPVNNYNSQVTLSILNGPNGASLGSHITAAVDNVTGVATFNQLIPNNATAGVPYTILATDTSSGATAQFSFSVTAAPNKLVFISPFAAHSNFSASSALPTVEVHVEDQNGNLVNYNGNLTITIIGQITNPNFAGTRTLPASGGVVSFSQLFLATPGTDYQLVASDANSNDTSAISPQFNLIPGTPFRPDFSAANGIAGSIVPPLAIQVDDIAGNFDFLDNDNSTMTLTIDSGPAGAPLGQVYTANVMNGIATFTGITLDTAGAYQFITTDPNVSIAGGGSLNITAATPTKLVFDHQPGIAAIGASIPAFTVQIQDAFGNIVTTDTSPVSIFIAADAITELDGVVTVTPQNGVATFNKISIPLAGNGYALAASDEAGDENALSAGFGIVPPATIYVDQLATGLNNGADWTDAFTNLQSALATAIPGDAIDVAAGDYTPGNNPADSFQLIDGVTLQGGFQTGGASGPNPTAFPSMLDGDGVNYHVVTGTGTDSTAVLNGFTIQGGNANGDADTGLGGGMFSDGGSPTLKDCTFTNNNAVSGGAVYNANEGTISTSATFDDCVFENNTAVATAGAMYNLNSSPTLVNCLFVANSTTAFAGAMCNDGSSPTLTNCTFTGNSATEFPSQGGAMANNSASDPTVTNCIFWNDTSAGGFNEIVDDVAGLGGSTQTVTYSDVSGGLSGAGNINTDPLFVDPNNPTTPNFQLQPTSPCINIGTNSDPALAGVATDLAGNNRFIDTIVDMGAYETQVVDVTWIGTEDGINWSDAGNWSGGLVPTLNDAVTIPSGLGTIQVADGTFGAFSLSTESPIEILTGSLTVAGESIFNSALLKIDGAGTFQAGAPSSTPQQAEVFGPIDDDGIVVAYGGVNLNSNIGGNGSVVVTGPGPAFFLGDFNYSGQTTISADATAYIESASSLPAGGSILNSGHLVINAGSSANPVIAGNIGGAGDVTIGTPGTPAYLMLANNTHTSTMSAVTVNAGSTFDINNNRVQINFGSPANDPVATITSELANAYNGGHWNGVSASAGVITSATAQIQGGPGRAIGIIDGNNDLGAAANQILFGYTIVGDAAKLDSHVDFNDLVAVVQNFNKSGTDWAHGNFFFDPKTNFADLVAVVQNFNKTVTPPASSLSAGPVPTAAMPLAPITPALVSAAPARPVNPTPAAARPSPLAANDPDADLLKSDGTPLT